LVFCCHFFPEVHFFFPFSELLGKHSRRSTRIRYNSFLNSAGHHGRAEDDQRPLRRLRMGEQLLPLGVRETIRMRALNFPEQCIGAVEIQASGFQPATSMPMRK
jgi:hypothetical protein